MTMTSTCTINAQELEKLSSPLSQKEFKDLRDFPRAFKKGVTNPEAKTLDFSNAKEKLPNISIELSWSVCNDDEIIESSMHSFLDYCTTQTPLQANCFSHQEGIPRQKIFTEESIYLFQMNADYDERLLKFVQNPSYVEDWFDKHLPAYSKCFVEGKIHTWFFIGPKGTKSEMHNDHDGVHTTIQQLDGEKLFFLISPDDMLIIEKTMGENYLKDIEFNLNSNSSATVSSLSNQDLEIFKKITLYTTTLQKHDIIYLPSDWGHYATSLSPSFSVSRDFIDDRNIDKYLFSVIFLSKHISKTLENMPANLVNQIIEENNL